ncbi:arsenite methyltransferase-like [Octopus sinensis]|uniref:Arsenite methyltransferase n=1 Tax=Octopus sinensis TaxID=2607531 RepID=A0A6P7U1F6_9MOLL|nr:arsenite methyltransferase-like [Octopus sinensis]
MCDSSEGKIHDQVKEYYGKTVKTTDDLKLSSCSVSLGKRLSPRVKNVIAMVHEDIRKKYYGCGLVIPESLEGMKILDLGSGSGQDCFALSKLVGADGYIVGVDMTQEQLDIANQYIDYHTKLFDYKTPNVKFVKGYIEHLTDAGFKENYFDIIISNCVINLSADKKAVLAQAYKILKEGGELYFSDMYADQEVPADIRTNKELWGEGLSGALYWKQLLELTQEIGFSQVHIVSISRIPVEREDYKKLIGNIKYAAVTCRLFKLPKNSKPSSAQVVYTGGIVDHEDSLKFSRHITFSSNKPVTVDADLHAILKYSRFGEKFQITEQNDQTAATEKVSCDITNPFDLLDNQEKQLKSSGNCCNGAN